MSRDAIAVCRTCGMPVRVTFSDNGEIEEVFAVCEHVQSPSDERNSTDG